LTPPTPFAWKRLLPLLALTIIYTLGLTLLAAGGKAAPEGTSILWRFVFALFVVRWIAQDHRSYDLRTPFEFSAFVFFAWIVVLPYYLCRTRGPRGLLNALGFLSLAVIPNTTAQVVRLFGAH